MSTQPYGGGHRLRVNAGPTQRSTCGTTQVFSVDSGSCLKIQVLTDNIALSPTADGKNPTKCIIASRWNVNKVRTIFVGMPTTGVAWYTLETEVAPEIGDCTLKCPAP